MKPLRIILIALACGLVGCQQNEREKSDEYRLIRPETRQGSTISIALYERAGDTNHVYMRTHGGDYIGMAK